VPLVFAAMAYPVRATLVVGATGLVGKVAISLASPGFELGRLLVQVTVLGLITVMAARIAHHHARAQARSEALAARLRELAHVDGLTGCLNHRGFRERLDETVADALRTSRPVSLLHADLDHFKQVNDSYGHPVGDRVLASIGDTLRGIARPGDVVGRMGGEEFVLLLPDTDLATAQRLAEDVRTAVGQLDGAVRVTASIGVSSLPEVADTEEGLVDTADRALYHAKRTGRDRVVVAAAPDTSVPPARAGRRDDLAVSSVSRLLDGGAPTRLHSVFQPLVDVHTGEIHGYEALARIEGSNVTPDRWLAAAEQEGRRLDLELAMLDTALDTYAAAPWAGQRPLFVNVSPDLLATRRLWERRERLPAGSVLELSERLVLSDSSILATAASRWVEAGVLLAIDDLGAGYANLRAVLELEPAFVKLDRTLVRELDTRDSHRALVGALVDFARQIGTTLVAEGVETDAELRVLTELGVPLVQGYGLARPGCPPPAVAPTSTSPPPPMPPMDVVPALDGPFLPGAALPFSLPRL